MHGRSREIASCRDIFKDLSNAFKTIKLYPGPNPVTQNLIGKLHKNLCSFLDEYGEMEADVTRFSLVYKGHEVYGRPEKTGNMAFSLFAAGIRGFTFKKGLEEDETGTFLAMLKQTRELTHWPGQRHIVVKISRDDFNFFCAAGPGAASTLKSGIIRPAEPGGARASAGWGPFEAGRFLACLDGGDESGRLFSDGILTLAGAMMQRGDASGFLALLKKLGALLGSQPGRAQAAIQTVIGRLSCLETATWFLEKSKNRQEAEDYLFLISPFAADTLINLLGQSGDRRMRRLICNVLAIIASRRLEAFSRYLTDRRWYLVRNIIMVLGMSGNPAALDLIERAVRHPAQKVRRECVRAVQRLGAEGGDKVLAVLVFDPDSRVRRGALKALLRRRLHAVESSPEAEAARSGPEKTFLLVKRSVSAPDFPLRAYEEKREFLEAFGFLGGQKAYPALRKFFSSRGMLSTRRRDELRAASAFGLAHIPLAEASLMLEEGARSRKRMLKTACALSLELRRKRFLFSGPAGLARV